MNDVENTNLENLDSIEKFGVKELKELLAFGFKLQKAITGAYQDKKINWMDSFRFTPVLMSGPAAFNGLNFIDDEILDLSEPEKVELREFAREYYPSLIENELQILIEDTIVAVMDSYKLAMRWANREKRRSIEA